MTPEPIAILRPGTFTDIHGNDVTVSPIDLAELAGGYDPVSSPAPFVIGHPPGDRPAHGWVAGLSFRGPVLVATPSKMSPALVEQVRAGRYRKVSASFYPRLHPANPKRGTLYLKHVGMLGAAAPAIKGLGVVALAAGVRAVTLAGEDFAPEPVAAARAASVSAHQHAERLRADIPGLSWSDALAAARREAQLVSLAEACDDPADRRRIDVTLHAVRLQTADPSLTFEAALDRARSTFANPRP